MYESRTYRGCNVWRIPSNMGGTRWESYCNGRFIRADTLLGMYGFIRDVLGVRS